MVVPTRSQNSSWHSLWDLQGTQAPQLRQSNNTLGGMDNTALLFRLNDVQVILDHVPWIRPDPVLAIYWLIRRDQLILNPNEMDRSFA